MTPREEDVLYWLAVAHVAGDRHGWYRAAPALPGTSRRVLRASARRRGWIRTGWLTWRGIGSAHQLTPDGESALREYIASFGGTWAPPSPSHINIAPAVPPAHSLLALGVSRDELTACVASLATPGAVIVVGTDVPGDARRFVRGWPRALRRRVARRDATFDAHAGLDLLEGATREVRWAILRSRLGLLELPEREPAHLTALIDSFLDSTNVERSDVLAAVQRHAEAEPEVAVAVTQAIASVPRLAIGGETPRDGQATVLLASTVTHHMGAPLSPWEVLSRRLVADHPEGLVLVLLSPSPRLLHVLGELVHAAPAVRFVVALSSTTDAWSVPTALTSGDVARLIAPGPWGRVRGWVEAGLVPPGPWCTPGRFGQWVQSQRLWWTPTLVAHLPARLFRRAR